MKRTTILLSSGEYDQPADKFLAALGTFMPIIEALESELETLLAGEDRIFWEVKVWGCASASGKAKANVMRPTSGPHHKSLIEGSIKSDEGYVVVKDFSPVYFSRSGGHLYLQSENSPVTAEEVVKQFASHLKTHLKP